MRPADFAAFPAKNNWEVERKKMQAICLQCHSQEWVNGHYRKLDEVVMNYNELYFKPVKKAMDELYAKKLLDKSKYFDERLEFEFYELWHHEGRRARMGAAMMAPDYTWWHGFYECKKRFCAIMEEAQDMIQHNKKAYRYPNFPGATGATTPPWTPVKK